MSDEIDRLSRRLDGASGVPDDADVEALLVVAARIGELGPVPDPPNRLASGRDAFIAAGVTRGSARRKPEHDTGIRPWLASLTAAWRPALVAASVALAVLLATATAIHASAAALPGDALYSVKRIEESLRLRLATAESLPALSAELATRRMAEAAAVAALGRDVTVSFRCLVASVEPNGDLACEGLPGVLVAMPAGVTAAEVAPGVVLDVQARGGPDGLTVVVAVTLAQSEPLIPLLPIEAGLPTLAAATERSSSGPSIPAPADRQSGATARQVTQAAPTGAGGVAAPPSSEAPSQGQQPAAPAPSEEIKPVVPTSAPAVTQAPATATVASPPAAPTVELSGILESFDPDSWRVNRTRIFIDPSTAIEGTPRVGAYVDVVAVRRPDGTLLARSLKVRGGASGPLPDRESGPVG